MNTLASRVNMRRLALGLTMQQLAEATGLSKGRISQIENNNDPAATMYGDNLARMASALRVHERWLRDGAGPMDRGDSVSMDAMRLAELYDTLPEEVQRRLLSYALHLVAEQYPDGAAGNQRALIDELRAIVTKGHRDT